MTRLSITLLFIILFFNIHESFAEESDDLDPEFDFSRHQKSTIENFPMQPIDQQGLSDAAIEGALKVQTQGSQKSELNRRPIYEKLDEEGQKKQTEKVLSNNEKDIMSSDDLLKFSQILPSQPQFQPIIYQQPTGRTYTDHQTSTIDRP
ncbi:MAG: hypothetical protein ACJAS1_000671 [Oleiphilaceae bacterium]|jgi:hypothetical protein